MKRISVRFCQFAVLVAVLLSAATAPVRAQECAAWITKLTAAINANPATQKLALDWMNRFQGASDPLVAKGMLKLAIDNDVKAVVEYFRDLPAGANPFAGVDDVYRAVGRFTGDNYNTVTPGFEDIIGNLAAEQASNEKGAVGALFVANRIVESGGSVVRFEAEFLDGDRFVDIIEAAAGAPEPLKGIHREVKNWPTALTGPADRKLTKMIGQFHNDILLHANSAFAFYRLDLHLANPGDLITIREAMEAAFDASNLPNRVIVKAEFLRRWNAGEIVTLF